MTKTVKIGNLGVGGRNPVRIKGMIKSSTKDTERVIKEARQLQEEGAEAIRIAVKDQKDAGLASILKKYISVPLVADIHFQYRLALLAIEKKFDSIRLNPLNIFKAREVKAVVQAAKQSNIPIRVGVNSGGFRRDFASASTLARQMVKAAESYLKILESQNFLDIMVSLKGSDISSTVIANKIFSQKHRYPLHLGLTATGSLLEGTIKSCLGLGNLLGQGIGDIIRISLTAPSFWEIRVAKYLLSALGLRKFGPQVIACPTCSRCEVDLIKIVENFKQELEKINFNKDINIAVMGCAVNGPGEAYQADLGAAFGKKGAVIFKKDKILRRTSEKRIIDDLISEVKNIWN